MLKKLVLALGVVALGLSFTSGARAQVTTTTLFGQVTDSNGAAVAGAEVTAMNQETSLSRSAQSNDQGEYRIEFLPVGKYSVGVTAAGFKKSVQTGVALDVGHCNARGCVAAGWRRHDHGQRGSGAAHR